MRHDLGGLKSTRSSRLLNAVNGAGAVVVRDATPDLMERGVEVVGRRQNERLDRHRHHRRSELARAVVREDQVLELDAQIARKVRRISRAASRSMPAPIDDVPDEVALDRVVGGDVVLELLELADVVQERAGDEQVAARAVGVGRGSTTTSMIFRMCSSSPLR